MAGKKAILKETLNRKDIDDHHYDYHCPICFIDFMEAPPKVLTCGHSLCNICIEKLERDNRVLCPFDNLPSMTNQIKTNYALSALVRAKERQGPKCRNHSSEVTHFFCLNDKAFICLLCFKSGQHDGHALENA